MTDGDEVNKYNTNPLIDDTDGDGIIDGMEIEYGFDPLAYDEGKDGCVTVIVDTPEEERDENVTASVEITIKKENLTQATEIEKASKNDASWNSIDENSPWFIGVPYEFDCPQDFERAKLTFTYDTSVYTGDDETLQPRIYYYNEETNQLEEVENQSVDIEKGEVSAEVSHFSTYVLLSKRGFDRALSLNALMYKEGDYSADEIAVIFVVDCSGSMAGNDPITYIDGESTCKRKQLINDIVDEMKNQSDEDGKIAGKAGLILFNGDVISDEDDKKPVCSLTDDYSKFSDGLELIGNYGGTYFKPAINLAIEELKQTDLPSKNIIMISDGQDNEWSNLETVKKYFEDKDVNGEIVIHTIGLGAGVDQENLRNISTATGGEYFYAADADQFGF